MRRLLIPLFVLLLCPPGLIAQKRKPRRTPAPSTTSKERIRELEALAEPPLFEFETAPKDVWMRVASGEYAVYFYNPAKISPSSDGTLKFWIKETAKDGSLYWTADVLDRRKREGLAGDNEKYAALDRVLLLYEVNCRKRQLRLLSVFDYARGGDVISSVTNRGEVEWDDLVPDSVGESYAEAVCSVRAKR